MRILICDDDDAIVTKLKKYVIEYFKHKKLKVPEISSYNNGEDLLNDSGEKNIIFLDVEMPGLNGIYIGRELKQHDRNTIIFIVTSFAEYLDDAMRFHVFRYLSKPLDKQRLFQNMNDALQLYNSTNTKIPLETKDGVYTVSASDIIFIEGRKRTIHVYTTQREYIVIPKMSHWIATLDSPCFFQSHRSFIVNMQYVTNFDHSLIHLYNDQYTAYLIRRKYSDFKEAYFLYLESMR